MIYEEVCYIYICYIPKTRQLNYYKTITRDVGTSKDRLRKMSYYIFRTKSTARLCSRIERTSQLPHGEPATVSGLLTQEVLMSWGSWVPARPLDLLGEALTTPISVSFPSRSQKKSKLSSWEDMSSACRLPAPLKRCISPLASPPIQWAYMTLVRQNRRILLWFSLNSEQTSWARHQNDVPRKSTRSSDWGGGGSREVSLKLLFSGTGNLPPVAQESSSSSEQ